MIANAVTMLTILAALGFGMRENAMALRDSRDVITTRELAAIRARQVIIWQAVAIVVLLALVVRMLVA